MPFFETNDHAQIYYRDWGTGKPVVFVGSYALSGTMWEYQMGPLSSRTKQTLRLQLACGAINLRYFLSDGRGKMGGAS